MFALNICLALNLIILFIAFFFRKNNSLPNKVLAKRIDECLVQTAAYTNPDITIKILADSLNVPVEKISAAINKEMNKNFFDLINEKRVNRAKELLCDKINKMTVEGIAYEAGFNSRASFYRAFKKYTLHTPSEYINQLP